ncbi:MAG: hypothetical protein V4819_04265 [Verrucomicrobiota bacterium]
MKRTDHQLIQQVLDGSISQQAFVGFQQRMRVEPELAKLYGDYAMVHHSLCEEFEGQPVPGKIAPVSRWTVPARIGWLAAAAAVVLLAVAIYRNAGVGGKPAPVMAAVQFSPDAVWQIEGASPVGGSSVNLYQGATLQLLQGQASLSPGPGVSGLIEGPSTLTFVSPESLHLAEGRGRFRSEKSGGKLEVTTASMSAVDLGTEFGIETHGDRPDELHVLEGKVRMRINGNREGEILSTGEAGRVSGADGIERFAADGNRFAKSLSRFESIVAGQFVKSDWRVDHGNPSISPDRIEGLNFSLFRRLPKAVPDEGKPVLLATLEVERPSNGEFHTDGWAGMSFFSKGTEVLFFGDSFGPERTWSLDVKQRIPVILPGNPVIGPRKVTLRYDRKTGEVSLHEGSVPLGSAFCSGKLPAGVTFDEVRIGASSNAALTVRSLVILGGG